MKMSSSERRAVFNLSTIMSLRIIGLFMALPVFSLYALQLHGATPLLVGLAIGVYGLTQAIFQIPCGALSDRFGRKPIIFVGLMIFILGSIFAGIAHSITLMIIGRSLQGIGAIGSTILAMIADLTREEHRTISMAIVGMVIGLSFGIAMLLGPLLISWISINYLFFIAAFFAFIAIFILFFNVPTPDQLRWHHDTEPELKSFLKILTMPTLAQLNIGIFILHAIFTATFIAIPIHLKQLSMVPAWQFYLPILFIAFIISLILMNFSKRKSQLKFCFLSGIMMLMIAESLFGFNQHSTIMMLLGLGCFFTSFSLLEAFIPSLISRIAPIHRKGTALGVYSCSQFLGIFIGGLLGGWFYGQFDCSGIYLFCLGLTSIWFVLSIFTPFPPSLIIHVLRLSLTDKTSATAALQIIPGIVEISPMTEEGIIYLKMERKALTHPDFIRLKEQLQ